MAHSDNHWWSSAVYYQIYVRSFADSNGDGIGDLRGIIGRLDYLQWLGVDAIWLTPCFPSPNKDWGYDVSDFRDIHPDYGTLEDADDLIREASEREIRVLFDLVPNHTSDRHEWFLDARSSRTSVYRDYYVWRDPKPDGSMPNNWLSVFGGPAWELDENTGQYYLHNFLSEQPDLDWWNDDVHSEFEDILRFWFDRGVAGFRIDVAHGIIKDRALRDNLPATRDDPPTVRRIGQRATYSMNQPQVHEIHKRWRSISSEYNSPERILTGETWVLELERMAQFYGTGDDELHLAFNFPFIYSDLEAASMSSIVETTESLIPAAAWPAWTGSNHDVGRFPSRWAGGDEDRTRCALLILLTLRGAPFLYYGDEIGMLDRPMAQHEIKDPVGVTYWPEDAGRDHCRTPMQWTSGQGAGFTKGDTPWLPIGDAEKINVAKQRDDDKSILSFCREILLLRRSEEDLRNGSYETVRAPDGAWVFRRGDRFVIAVNLGKADVTVEGIGGRIVAATNIVRKGNVAESEFRLDPGEGVIVKSAGRNPQG